MPGIYAAAAITTVIAIATWVVFLMQLATKSDRRWLMTLVALGTLCCPIAYFGVRLPVRPIVREVLGADSVAMRAYRTIEAPLTEEPLKLAPLLLLLVPTFRRRLTRESVVPTAFALGLGFGIGEIWLVANLIAQVPRFAELPFYEFIGFVGERLVVCVWAVLALSRGPLWLPLGLLAGMTLHFTANFPVFLAPSEFGGIKQDVFWPLLLTLWILLLAIVTLIALGLLHFGLREFKRLTNGKARCPSCNATYNRPGVLAFNLGLKRYDRCPSCKNWHWIDIRNNVEA